MTEPIASTRPVRKLRVRILLSSRRLLPRRRLPSSGRLRLLPARPLAVAGQAAEAALQVVEDEADGRLGPGRRRDYLLAVADDEDVSRRGRGVELRDRAVAASQPVRRCEQRECAVGDPARALLL